MITNRRLSWLILLAALRAADALALDPHRLVTQYVHDVWQSEQGLPQNSVLTLLQTRDGYLWLGTQEGLVRFDGVRFTVLDTSNTPGMTNHFVHALLEGKDGSLWIGTFGGGLLQLREGRMRAYTTQDGLVSNAVSELLEDGEGSLWVGTDHGLSRLRQGGFTSFTTEQGLPGNVVYALARHPGGGVWIGTGGGLSLFRDGELKSYGKTEGLPHPSVSALHLDADGKLWVGTYDGLAHGGERGFSAYAAPALANLVVTGLLKDRQGNLWVGTSGGLHRFHQGQMVSFTPRAGLSAETVNSLLEDREGSLWIGTDGGGLNRLRDGKAVTFGAREGLPEENVRCVLEDREGALWMGTQGGGLSRLQDGRLTTYTLRDGLTSNSVFALHQDRQGDLWIGTLGGGLVRRRGGTFRAYTKKDGLSNDFVWSIHEDRRGRLWVGTSSGLNRMEGERFTVYTSRQGLSGPVLTALFEDRQGALWIGTSSGGLSRFQDDRFTTYTTREGLSHNGVRSFHEDAQGNLWIGTLGGLQRWQAGRFTSYGPRQGLFSDAVFRILDDGAGHLWMSGNKGIYRVRRADLDAFDQGRLRQVPFTTYNRTDGMRSAECNGGSQPAGVRLRDGRLCFATIRGVVFLHGGQVNALPPPVMVEDVLADGRPAAGRPVEVGPGARGLELRYTGLSFLTPERVRFKYRLEGFDEEWVEAGPRRVAYYTNLPPGSYRFRVVAGNEDGVWNETGASLDLTLRPHLHQTRWFYGLCALALGLAAFGAHRLRVHHLAARERALVRLVDERTHSLAEANRSLAEAKGQLEEANAELEERVRKGVAALREADRLAAYGRLVAGVAHEVRNPIFALQTAVYTLGEKLTAAERPPELRTIQRESERMTRLMEDLLELAKPKDLLLAPTDPATLLAEATETCATEGASAGLSVTVPDAMPKVVLDRGRMLQVLCNLVENARKHAEGATTIRLAAQPGEGSEVRFTVADDGRGIPREDLPRVFEPFFTTGHGTGLGLAIVHRIVTDHGGRITVESDPGRGTVFTIVLPVSGPPSRATANR